MGSNLVGTCSFQAEGRQSKKSPCCLLVVSVEKEIIVEMVYRVATDLFYEVDEGLS